MSDYDDLEEYIYDRIDIDEIYTEDQLVQAIGDFYKEEHRKKGNKANSIDHFASEGWWKRAPANQFTTLLQEQQQKLKTETQQVQDRLNGVSTPEELSAFDSWFKQQQSSQVDALRSQVKRDSAGLYTIRKGEIVQNSKRTEDQILQDLFAAQTSEDLYKINLPNYKEKLLPKAYKDLRNTYLTTQRRIIQAQERYDQLKEFARNMQAMSNADISEYKDLARLYG